MLGLIPAGQPGPPRGGRAGRCPVRRGWGRQPGRCLPGDNGFFCLAAQFVASSCKGPSVGALSGRCGPRRPEVAFVPAASCQPRSQARQKGPRGAGMLPGAALPRDPERRSRPGMASEAPCLSPRWHLQLAHGSVVFGFRLRDFNQPALLLGGRKSELYFSHWPEQKTEASAGVWEWFMG